MKTVVAKYYLLYMDYFFLSSVVNPFFKVSTTKNGALPVRISSHILHRHTQRYKTPVLVVSRLLYKVVVCEDNLKFYVVLLFVVVKEIYILL